MIKEWLKKKFCKHKNVKEEWNYGVQSYYGHTFRGAMLLEMCKDCGKILGIKNIEAEDPNVEIRYLQ